MGKSKPSVTLTNALLVLNVKLTHQRTCQHPDILASLDPLIFLKHLISKQMCKEYHNSSIKQDFNSTSSGSSPALLIKAG